MKLYNLFRKNIYTVKIPYFYETDMYNELYYYITFTRDENVFLLTQDGFDKLKKMNVKYELLEPVRKSYKRCEYCYSEFVCWNAFFPGCKGWLKHIFGGFLPNGVSWKIHIKNFPIRFANYYLIGPKWFFARWSHECWQCDRMSHSFFKIKSGIPRIELNRIYDMNSPASRIHDLHDELFYCIDTIRHLSDSEHDEKVLKHRRDGIIETVNEIINEQLKRTRGYRKTN